MTTAKANGRVRAPFDLDAASAAADEAELVPFAFTWRGDTFEMMSQALWPMTVVRLMAEGNLPAVMPVLVGDEAWDKLSETMVLGDLVRLFGAVGEASGLGGLPNSPLPAPAASTRT